jgi:Protein of unknown function (DUF1592)/Protein of unknown function (DUF1587)
VVRRLNRNEYSNAIRDLLAIELPVAAELPQDGIAAGFDNISDALSMSPLLLEWYLKVARRVSFFLWSSIPDDDLLSTAGSGKLRDAAALDWEVRPMLADPRAGTLAGNSAAQWLGLRGLADIEPDRQIYPEFDSALRAAFESETRLFVHSLIRENRSVLDLLGGTTRTSTRGSRSCMESAA